MEGERWRGEDGRDGMDVEMERGGGKGKRGEDGQREGEREKRGGGREREGRE